MKLPVRTLLAALLPLTLAGCINDAASYMVDGNRNNAITLTRTQKWFWEDKVILSVISARQPDCMSGVEIQNVPSDQPIPLHQAPDEYAEPIYILDVAGTAYAISTQSCQIQKFADVPTDQGPVIGRFETVAGQFQYVPTK